MFDVLESFLHADGKEEGLIRPVSTVFVVPLQRSVPSNQLSELSLDNGECIVLIITYFVKFLDVELMLGCTIEQAHIFREVKMLKDKLCISFGINEMRIEDIDFTNGKRLKKKMDFLL